MTDSRSDRGTADLETRDKQKSHREVRRCPTNLPHAMPLRPSAALTSVAAIFIAALAILLRLPACGESFWVDELHSAWAIWSDWQEIAGRAERGNQTPWYFYVLWCWRHFVGDSEIALRLPSVIATALASAVLVAGGARNGGGLLGGIIAGLLMAVDRNAIFFGTEARPYAGVILAVAAAAWAGVEIRGVEIRGVGVAGPAAGSAVAGSSARRGAWWARGGLLLACFMGFLWHATAAIPLAALATALFAWPRGKWQPHGSLLGGNGTTRGWGERCRSQSFSAYDYLAVVAVMVLVLWINADVIFRVWSERSQWSAFGRPRAFRELWTIWPWTWLVLLPVGLWSAVHGLRSWTHRLWNRIRGERRQSILADQAVAVLLAPILAAAVLATAIAWVVSCLDIAPIWHRRFMVGVLPLLCWTAGGYWGASVKLIAARIPWPKQSASSFAAAAVKLSLLGLVAAVAVGGLMFSQGTLPKLIAGDRVLVSRGEDWRGAVAFLQRHRRPSDPVFVAAELLESTALDPQQGGSPEPSPRMLEYLRYPVSGPYPVEDAIPLGRQAEPIRRKVFHELHRRERMSSPGSVWVLLRNGQPQSLAVLSGGDTDTGDTVSLADSLAMHPFGGVTLVQISAAASE